MKDRHWTDYSTDEESGKTIIELIEMLDIATDALEQVQGCAGRLGFHRGIAGEALEKIGELRDKQ